MGAFRIALESIFNRIHHSGLEYTSFGKPNPFVFKNAEAILRQLHPSCHNDSGDMAFHAFEALYMIGDNPLVDIKGARQAGHPWFSILTRTGVFRGKENHAEFPADLVVDTVEEAVEYILRREGAM
uniref:Hydrolase family protein / HAD-superfamily protein n=1 Tax=Davidia involucrata TaxID=16924 RepID=A0A5B7BHI6_DAVIN